MLAAKLRSAINVRFHGDDKPDIVCTDRGRGFYVPKTGKITALYAGALREHDLFEEFGSPSVGDLVSDVQLYLARSYGFELEELVVMGCLAVLVFVVLLVDLLVALECRHEIHSACRCRQPMVPPRTECC